MEGDVAVADAVVCRTRDDVLRAIRGGREFVLDDHHDDAEHPHDQSVITDPFTLLKKSFSATQTMGQAGKNKDIMS